MEKYVVKVNGKEYEVELELVDNLPTESKKVETKASGNSGSGMVVEAPMQGTMLKILVSNQQVVKKGEVLGMLEAMKMENEIVAPCDGTVVIHTTLNEQVKHGQKLFEVQ